MGELESVHRRTTRLIPFLRNKPYHVRVKELDLFTVKKEYRSQGQLIRLFQDDKLTENVDVDKLPTKSRG